MSISKEDEVRIELLRRTTDREKHGMMTVAKVQGNTVTAHQPQNTQRMSALIKENFDAHALRGVLNKVFDEKQALKDAEGNISVSQQRKLENMLKQGRESTGIDKN